MTPLCTRISYTLKVFYFKYSFSIDIFLSSVDVHPVLKADSIKYIIIFRNMVRSKI